MSEELKAKGPNEPFVGQIQVYTGNCKGKTTASLGLALRAVGHGAKVCMIQFTKHPEMMGELYGEIKAKSRLEPHFEMHQFGRKAWVHKGKLDKEDIRLASEALKFSNEKAADPSIHILILDEILNALWFELITLDDVLNIMDKKLKSIELIITGRNAPDEVIERAGLVTEMKQIKHYYDKGIEARKTIEY